MFNLEAQKERFENHKATFTDLGNIKILDFQVPNQNEYRIRFLFEEDYCRLHISGDLGELIAVNYYNMTFEKFRDFIGNPDYFAEKVVCSSRDIFFYNEDLARKQAHDLIQTNPSVQRAVIEYAEDILCMDEEELYESVFLDKIFEDFDKDFGLGPYGKEIIEDCNLDIYDFIQLGHDMTGIPDLYLLAFDLAMKDLESQNVSAK